MIEFLFLIVTTYFFAKGDLVFQIRVLPSLCTCAPQLKCYVVFVFLDLSFTVEKTTNYYYYS